MLLNPLVNEAIEGGFQGGGWSLVLELLHQPLQVVGRARPAEQVAAGLPLAHPEMGPALGELANAASFDGPIHAEQGGQPFFGGGTAEGNPAGVTELAGATGSGKAFAQQPGASACLKANLHLRQPAVEPRAQLLYSPARGRGLQEEALVQGFHQGAFARLIGAANQGEARMEGELEVFVLAHLAQHRVV